MFLSYVFVRACKGGMCNLYTMRIDLYRLTRFSVCVELCHCISIGEWMFDVLCNAHRRGVNCKVQKWAISNILERREYSSKTKSPGRIVRYIRVKVGVYVGVESVCVCVALHLGIAIVCFPQVVRRS